MIEPEPIDFETFISARNAYVAQLKKMPHKTWLEWRHSAESLHREAARVRNMGEADPYPSAYSVAQYGYYGIKSAPIDTDELAFPQNNKEFRAAAYSLLNSGRLIEDIVVFLIVRDLAFKLEKALKGIESTIRENEILSKLHEAKFIHNMMRLEIADLSICVEEAQESTLTTLLTDVTLLGAYRPVPHLALEDIAWFLKYESMSNKAEAIELAEKILSYDLKRPAHKPFQNWSTPDTKS